MRVDVQDMRLVTPSRFIEIGGGVVNEVSYQVARGYGIKAGGVYVASSGHVLGSANAWRGSVIVSVNNIATPSLDAFAAALGQLHEGSRVPIRLFALDKPHREKVVIMNVTTHWHALRMATRDECTGYWHYRDLDPPKIRVGAIEPQTASVPHLPATLAPAHRVWASLVYLDFHIPYLVDGMKSTQFAGPGFIVDKAKGLIACDRDTVPMGVGDVYITIAGSIVLAGRVEFLHPVYNFAIVKYDPQLIGTTPVEDISFHPDYYEGSRRLAQGDDVFLVGVSADQSPVVRRTEVSSRAMVSTRECVPPRFRCTNVEGVKLHDQPSCQGGVLCDSDGRAMALWVGVSSQDSSAKDLSTMSGLDVAVLRPTIQSLRSGRGPPDFRSLDVVLWTMRLAPARTLGLSPARIRQIEGTDNARLFYVLGHAASESPAATLLATGDIILEKNGCPVGDVSDIGVIQDAPCVDLVVLRDGKELALKVPTTRLSGMDTRRVVHWLGALVQQPYRAVHEQVRRLPSAVYVSCTLYGSPANCYGLRPGMWITEVENRPITSIDDFVAILNELQLGWPESADEEPTLRDMRTARYVRITVVSKNDVTKVLSLRVDRHFWPAWQLVHDPTAATGWNSIHHL
ncbi:hypothetical protein FBU31_005797 [Coemansia sp. 'formosensis']|nr:hypothetical protein FBU31_005797 [Coemansia sp. 'formosensis']